MYNDTPETTKYWRLYEKGIEYINRKRLVQRTNRNWNFFAGKQWEGIQTGGLELPFLNFIKPVIRHKVSTVSQNNMIAHYSDAEGNDELAPVYERLDQKFSASWEHANMDMVLWQTIKDAAVTGDGILYFGTKDIGDCQRLPNTTVLYGNESETDIQKQPYVIIHQRLLVKTVKEMARQNGLTDEEIRMIIPDQDIENTVGNTDEVENTLEQPSSKVTVLFFFEKIDGIVHITKCTKTVVFEAEHPIASKKPDGSIDKGLTLYPLLKISWEDYPNDARGLSEVEQLIPNQLEVNKTLARRSMIIQLTAYPRLAYKEDALQNPEALEQVGKPLAIGNGMTADSVNQAISYLNPAQSNSDPKNYADDIMEYSQELSGSGETAMGNINPNRVAASAIIAIRDQAALPLNEQVAKMKTFVEEYAKLAIEMWMVYNPCGMDVLFTEEDPITGEKTQVMQTITKEDWDRIKPEIRIDTSQDNPWTKEAEQNFLDGALDKGYITFEEYVDIVPEKGIVPKNKLQTTLKKRQAAQAAMAAQQVPEQEEEIDPELYALEQWNKEG